MKEKFLWQTASPESQGMSTPKLNALRDILAAKHTKAFLVIRHDRIVYEWYASDHGQKKRHYTASLAKALVGGVSLMLALHAGHLAVDEPACKYIPAWQEHPEKSRITIRHLATHSSGIEDAEQGGLPHDRLPGWKGAFWKREPDPFSIARDRAPVIFPPGSDYAYSNPGTAMLAYAVTASLNVAGAPCDAAPQSDILSLLRERIMEPIGAPAEEWSIGYGRGYELDGLTLYANWGGGSYTARAVARVGRLMLRKGDWEGEQLVAPEWAEKVVEYAGTPLPERSEGNPEPGSGLGWWTNFDRVWEAIPRDAFAGAGAGNQILVVIPSLDMIIVRNGATLGDEARGEGFWGGVEKYLFNPLMASITSSNQSGKANLHSDRGEIKAEKMTSYPPSPVITSVDWAPAESIVRQAMGRGRDGSDNWPLTWADDDNLYTAYGDGYGFDPIVPQKLGLGFAKVIGEPTDFTGENIRSDAENSGMGASGKKASGLLMVDGVLYMWVRNADEDGHYCQLARSNDYARTWVWCGWRFEECGYLTFINFGQNYTRVPDQHKDYVYMVSHDNPNAYEPADRFILARVPVDEIMNRDAYEFYVGVCPCGISRDPDDTVVWTKDIQGRGAVFKHPGRCLRSGISYNAGLGRYLWWHQEPRDGADTRFRGGFAIYDAPEPWGPWTTVYYTQEWDVGPGETASFPTKWMSADGKICYLVFSGNDNFSVRKVTFTLSDL